jgi:hypothetical protein
MSNVVDDTLRVTGASTFDSTTTLNSITYTWPASQAAGLVLQTNGSGTLSWATASGGGQTVQTTTSTGTQNNFAATAARVLVLRCNNASLLTLTGLAAGTDGDMVYVLSVGAGRVDIANQDASSSAANRVINGVTGTISLVAGVGTAQLVYDATTARWRVVDHEQGGWITPTFNAADYTASGSMTWTVDAGDVGSCAYYLKGRSLSVTFVLQTTSVGGTPSNLLLRVIPGGFTCSDNASAALIVHNNSVWSMASMNVGTGASTLIGFGTDPSATVNWTASTNTTYVYGSMTIPVA